MKSFFFCCSNTEENDNEVNFKPQLNFSVANTQVKSMMKENFALFNQTKFKVIEKKLSIEKTAEGSFRAAQSNSHTHSTLKENSTLRKDEDPLNTYPRLIIKEKDGNLLEGQEIIINPNGIMRSAFNDESKNFTINNTESNKLIFFQIFEIFFDRQNYHFILKCLRPLYEQKEVLFIKLTKKLKISRKTIISLGEFHFSINLSKNGGLSIDMINSNNINQMLVFNPDLTKTVRVGRGKENEIYLKNNSLSRTHMSLSYDEDEKIWSLEDGFQGKKSTNGTWIFADSDWKIEESLILKTSTSLINVDLVENDNSL